MKGKIREDYFNWLINLTYGWCSQYGNYSEALSYLYSRQFYYVVYNDNNRSADGIDLRFKFVEQNDEYTYRDVYLYLMQPCTVLEMMAGLAIRCEDHIMGDPSEDDHTDIWFWEMMESTHLSLMPDGHFDERTADKIVTDLLDRKYKKNGDGGLFRINDKTKDMRMVEIWCQLSWFLKEYTGG